ncbi:MAG: B12-binding domain-containing radical SAM protein [Verrucomicrobia bacterium]|nr:B12-binding domain-containing radical SAM protein [Verrucomicrobiota bacterium]
MSVLVMLDKLSAREGFAGHHEDQQTEALLTRLFPSRDIKKVLLVTPPDVEAAFFRYENAKRRRYSNYPPYGLAILAGNLREIDIAVKITNLNHEVLKRCFESNNEVEFDFDAIWKNKLEAAFHEFEPDLIGVTCMFTMTHGSLRNVCNDAGQYGVPVAIGGVHVTNDIERVLADIASADIAFLQEADLAFRQFIQVVNRQLPVTDLAQVIIRDGKELYPLLKESKPTSEQISNIPAFDLLEIPDYSSYGIIGSFYHLKPPETRFSTVLSNRGCRANCTFCSVAYFNGRGVRQRTISSVVDELEILQNEYGIGHIMWLDDDLLKDHKRTVGMFEEMVRRGLRLTWDATNGVIAASCTDEVISAAAASGCIGLHIGMESGNPAILHQIKKPGTVDKFLAAAEAFHKHPQIFASVFLMIGFPGETKAMIFDTINVARQMDMDWYSIGQLQPLPNTPIYDAMVAQGLIPDVGSKQTRFMNGPHGRASEREKNSKLASSDFEDAFAAIPADQVPAAEYLTDIWFYMDYHLNFHRLFREVRPIKMDQQIKKLRKVSDILLPDHAFALYFLGYLQHRTQGNVEPDLVRRLEKQLVSSSYWQERFKAFKLSPDHLKNGDFNSHAPSAA